MTTPEPTGDYDQPAAGGGPTGHPRVDGALAGLAEVADRPPQEQVEPLAQAHGALTETLESIGDV
jgi:hypothetical protein